MTARTLVIGLDAAEATLIEQWAEVGMLPNFSRLARQGGVGRLDNCLQTLPGNIWPEISTGRSCGRLPLYYHSRMLHTGEARMRAIAPEDDDPASYYWNVASRAGRRVAVIDQPQTVACDDFNGIQVFEWGLHDRSFSIESRPPGLMAKLVAKYGEHPVRYCDRHGECPTGYHALLERLLEGVQRKTALMLDLLNREPWDLFACTYGEPHCAGHQFWHFRDPAHPWHDPAAPDIFKNAIRSVYQQIDKGIGQLMDAAGPDAGLFVFTSHGMGLYTGGPQLLPEFLVRLGLGSGKASSRSGWVRRFQIACSHVPRPLQPAMRWIAESPFARGVQRSSGCLPHPLESPETRAVSLRNNRCGAIRLNLAGREPYGQVKPGQEADALLDEIRRALLELRQPDTGKPIVEKVQTAIEAFGTGHHPDVPDLMVVFRTDLGMLEACRSERLGLIRQPLYHPNIPRSGDHTTESRLWFVHPAIQPDTVLSDANVLDLAPSILHCLGIDAPPVMDGRVLPELLPTVSAACTN